jgi:hypothetical protein
MSVNIERLRSLNFCTLLTIDHPDPSRYSVADYRANDFHHPKMRGYCTACEEAGVHVARDNPDFRLGMISHGAHSTDYLDSVKDGKLETAGWHEEGVLFLFESPSWDPSVEVLPIGIHRKRPPHTWYWVDRDQPVARYPDYFRGRAYGTLVRSVITTFRLANAYVTNLVKCGLNNSDATAFRGIGQMQDACVRMCYGKFLSQEIAIVDPRVVFAFGTAVFDWVRSLTASDRRIQLLPHPARARSGFRDEYYEVLYLWLIARALVAEHIISHDEARDCLELFLARAKVHGSAV